MNHVKKMKPSQIEKKPSVKKSKASAQRAQKRAAARKARKTKLLALLSRYDKALKDGRPVISAKLLSSFRLLKVSKPDIEQMRSLSKALAKAEAAVARQRENLVSLRVANGKTGSQTGIAANEKKLNDAIAQLKKAQIAEQQFFLTLTRAQANNGSCPFCSVDRISVDSHVMDVHPPRWGEYITLLGKI